MKKSIFNFSIALLMSGTVLTGCQSSATKVENANDKVDAAKDQVELAPVSYTHLTLPTIYSV